MLLIISAVLYALSVIPLVSLMRIKQTPRYLCTFFVISIAEIILTGNLLGLFHQLNNKGLWLAIQAIILFISWGVWSLCKRPALFEFQFQKNGWHHLRVFQKIVIILLGIFVLAAYGTLIYLILVVPPNNNDSMVVHLVRVGYWLQHGSFLPWQNFIERQIIYPYDAQIVVLWSILFHGTDLFAPFLQYFSVLFTALGIYGIAREIGGSRYQSGLAALFYLTFPQVILQATTTQDDLVVTCFLVLGAYFFLRWYGNSYITKSDLLLAAMSLMIAVGIKPTAFYFFIGFAIFILVLIFIKKIKVRQLLQLGLTCLAAFCLLSSYAYITNTVYFHNPLGPADFVSSESGIVGSNLLQKTGVNSGRFIYEFFSLDGLPPVLIQKVQSLKVALALKAPAVFNTSSAFIKDPGKPFRLTDQPGINEDYSWFGPVSFLLLIPAFIFGLIRFIKTKDQKILFLLLIPLFILLGISVLRPGWDPYQGRYFNPGIAIAMPLLIFLVNRQTLGEIYLFLLSLLAIFVMTCSVLLNDSKPMVTQRTVERVCNAHYLSNIPALNGQVCKLANKFSPYLLPKLDIASLNSVERETYSSQQQYPIISQFSEEIPAGSRIGLALLNGDWEYPFFGRHFEYQLVPVVDRQTLQDQNWITQNHLDYLIVHQEAKQMTSVDPSFSLQDQIGNTKDNFWQIYRR